MSSRPDDQDVEQRVWAAAGILCCYTTVDAAHAVELISARARELGVGSEDVAAFVMRVGRMPE